jgi:hypothetical protein
MLLSPLAKPFQPAFGSPTAVVCNDGLPSMVGLDIHAIVQGYQDEALDENFPPSAQEAAELEAVEMFVDILATLSMLEDREERARSSFCHVQKRWEARREDGLKGKPKPAKHLVDSVNHHHHDTTTKQLKTTDLVPFAHTNRELLAAALLQSRQQTRAESRRSTNPKVKSNQQQPRPLQQPRKMN